MLGDDLLEHAVEVPVGGWGVVAEDAVVLGGAPRVTVVEVDLPHAEVAGVEHVAEAAFQLGDAFGVALAHHDDGEAAASDDEQRDAPDDLQHVRDDVAEEVVPLA